MSAAVRLRPGVRRLTVAVAALAFAAVSTWLLIRAGSAPDAAPSHLAVSRTMVLDFQGYRFGAPPTEFRYDPTGTGQFDRPTWRVFADPTAPSPPLALVQSPAAGDPASAPLAVLRGVQTRDLDASVGLKPMGGTQSSAGLAWHVHGHTSFYAAIADARKERLEVIVVSDARPTVLASVPIPIAIEFERSSPSPSHGWFALRVRSTGQRITVWFDAGAPRDPPGAPAVELSDPTLTGAGEVALLTRGDTVAAFDDLSVRYDETPGEAR